MKSLNKLLVISLLAIVLIFSGCIGGGDRKNQTFGSGLNVISFTALRQVDSAEQFDLDLVVQNIGDKDATNIQADLFQTSAITILNNRVQTESRLLPPDIEKGIEGEDTIFSWSLQAPTLTEDQTKSLQARITYDYTSTATSNLYIVSKAELDEKGAHAFPTYSTSSRGPVTLSIVEMPPFKVTSGQTNARVQVNLIIENTGFGRVVNNEVRDFAIVLKGEGTERDITNNCPDIVSGRIKLYGKEQERSIRCSLVLPFSETAVSYIVEAEMGYTYYIDTNPLAVRVKGGTGTSSTTVITYRQPASLQNEPIGDWWDDIVDICVDKWGLRDPYFIAAIVKKESWFDASAFNAGEKQAWEAYQSGQTTVKPWHEEYYGKGLMQITGPWIAGVPRPSTFEWQYNMPPEAIQTQAPVMTDAYNGRQNLDRGCWYMKALLNHYGNDQYKAATAYRFGWQGTDAGSFDPYDNNYVNDVFRYKSEYLQNVGYTENQFPSRP